MVDTVDVFILMLDSIIVFDREVIIGVFVLMLKSNTMLGITIIISELLDSNIILDVSVGVIIPLLMFDPNTILVGMAILELLLDSNTALDAGVIALLIISGSQPSAEEEKLK